MSAVSEVIVREYFEAHGFLVHQPRKYSVAARAKRMEEEIDLVVFNPRVAETRLPADLLWTGPDLASVASAVVGIRGWHTDRFSPAVLGKSPEIFRFAQSDAVKQARGLIGVEPAARILCLPDLPAGAASRAGALALLKAKGIDGVLLFRTMLVELAEHVEISKSYERSDLLQVLRILKNYDLLKDAQMEWFRKSPQRRKPT